MKCINHGEMLIYIYIYMYIQTHTHSYMYVTTITLNLLSDKISSNVIQVKSDLSCYNSTTMLLDVRGLD